jgi:hypothetical protein
VRSLLEIFKTPGLIFILTLFGLVAALLTEGIADIVGVAATASTLVIITWVILKSTIH